MNTQTRQQTLASIGQRKQVTEQLWQQGRKDAEKGRDYDHAFLVFVSENHGLPLAEANAAYGSGYDGV